MKLTEEVKRLMAELYVLRGEVVEVQKRAGNVGRIMGWASSQALDSHGSEIDPDEVIRLLTTASVPDQEHDFAPVDGVRFEDIHLAKRMAKDPATGKDRLMTGVSFAVVCDLAVRAAESYYQKFLDGTYRGFSIAFRAAADKLAEWKSGITKRIEGLLEIPFVSAVGKPSNPLAMAHEIRSAFEAAAEPAAEGKPPVDAEKAAVKLAKMRGVYKMLGDYRATSADFQFLSECLAEMDDAGSLPMERQILLSTMEARLGDEIRADVTTEIGKEVPHGFVVTDLGTATEQTLVTAETVDAIDLLSKDVAALKDSVGSPLPSDPTAPASSQSPVVAAADDTRIAELAAKVAAVETGVAELRALITADAEKRSQATDAVVTELREELAEERQRSDKIVTLVRKALPELVTRAELDATVKRLTAAKPRIGDAGQMIEGEVAAEIRKELAKIPDQTKRGRLPSAAVNAPR